jgi:predicted SAM-dependent methyltransferase
VFDGWANLDVGGGDGVVPYDLTGRLPFPDGSLDQVFTEHFIEHVSRARGVRFLAECARILRPDGVLRVSTPDLRRLVDGDQLGRTTEWEDQGWEPQTPARLIKEGYTFPYDENELSAALGEAGFSRMKRVGWHESEHADLRDLERRSLHGDLILEASR